MTDRMLIVSFSIFIGVRLKTLISYKGENVKSSNATFANRKNQAFDEVVKFINMPV